MASHWALVKCSISTKSLGCFVRFAHFGGPILGAPTMTSSWSSHESKHECSSEVAAVRLHQLGFNTPGGGKPLGGFVFKIELSLEFWRFGAAKVQYCL